MTTVATPRTHGDYQLSQLVGQRKNNRTSRIEIIRTDTDEVLHCGQRIGYVGRHSGAPFCPIVPNLSPDRVQETLDAIKVIRMNDGCIGLPNGAGKYPDALTPELMESLQSANGSSEQDGEDVDDE